MEDLTKLQNQGYHHISDLNELMYKTVIPFPPIATGSKMKYPQTITFG